MKNLYRIINKNGATVCFQVAKNEKDAVDYAHCYGHKSAAKAEFVRAN